MNASWKKVNHFVVDNCCDDDSDRTVMSYCTYKLLSTDIIYYVGGIVVFKFYFTYYDVVLFITSERVNHVFWCCFKTIWFKKKKKKTSWLFEDNTYFNVQFRSSNCCPVSCRVLLPIKFRRPFIGSDSRDALVLRDLTVT